MAFNQELAHCSSHVYYSNGCPDCEVAVLYQARCASDMMKTVTVGTHPLEIFPTIHNPRIQLVEQQLIRKLYVFLTNSSLGVAQAINKKGKELDKITDKQKQELFLAAYAAIQWGDLVNNIISDLYEATYSGGLDGLNQLQIKDNIDNSNGVELFGHDYSVIRAAEMVGKKIVDGKLVDYPEAKLTITSLTHDDLKDVIEDSLDRGMSISDIENEIKKLGIFSKSRASLIADTELSMAQFQGNIKVWKKSGLISKVKIVVSDNHDVEDVCDDVVNAGPYTIDQCPNLPIHPNCECGIAAVELVEQ